MAELPMGWIGPKAGTPVAARFLRFMASHLQGGTLVVADDTGTRRFGDGLPEVTMVIHDRSVYWSTLLQGSVGLGRDYADGLWDCDDLTTLTRVLNRGLRPVTAVQDRVGQAVGASTDWLRRFRPPSKHVDRNNIQAHYDVSNDFFALMLDETMMYSSAIFSGPGMDLGEAQRVKLDRLCTKLGLVPDDHLVEIGTGWGGFACHAAANYGCRVTTTTISDAQFRYASKRVVEEGLTDRVTVLNRDFRELEGTFDKLVAIEMVEAVDWRQHDTFFRTCTGLLHDRGLMALQAITVEDRSFERAKNGTDFVREFIFPGGCLPSIEAISRSLRRATPMVVVDVEDIGRHYAETLRRWDDQVADRADEVAALGLDTRFQRLWHFYLCYCAGAFLERHISDVQMVMAMPDWEAPMSVRDNLA
ncbi:MAG TPA: cyclopropane-fatty-acyl-phospholipid synthase family protein [Acidimicrobiales bacterium]